MEALLPGRRLSACKFYALPWLVAPAAEARQEDGRGRLAPVDLELCLCLGYFLAGGRLYHIAGRAASLHSTEAHKVSSFRWSAFTRKLPLQPSLCGDGGAKAEAGCSLLYVL